MRQGPVRQVHQFRLFHYLYHAFGAHHRRKLHSVVAVFVFCSAVRVKLLQQLDKVVLDRYGLEQVHVELYVCPQFRFRNVVPAQLPHACQLLETVLDVVYAFLQLYSKRYLLLAGTHRADIPERYCRLFCDGHLVFLTVLRPLILRLAQRPEQLLVGQKLKHGVVQVLVYYDGRLLHTLVVEDDVKCRLVLVPRPLRPRGNELEQHVFVLYLVFRRERQKRKHPKSPHFHWSGILVTPNVN